MDAGGLAQMTYNNNSFAPNGGSLGLPGAGFASRGKGAQLKRLSVAAPPKVSSISENESVATPRTSRSHLLAGLRTAPKTPGAPPASAPFQQQHRYGAEQQQQQQQQQYGGHNAGGAYGQPHTAIGNNFPGSAHAQYGMNSNQQHLYSLSEQVLAPPSLQYDLQDGGDMDPNMIAQLMATELYLQQRQQQLQQQLMNLTAQQFGGMNVSSPLGMRQAQFPQTPITPQMGYYNQQQMQPQEVPGQPGVYLVYNPLTGQYTYAMDPNAQLQQQQQQQQHIQLANSPPPQTPSHNASFNLDHAQFRAQLASPVEKSSTPFSTRSITPPKKTPSPPANVEPLPPPSANAFRPGHKKGMSSAFKINTSGTTADGPKSAFVRPVGMPATPQTGTFGPGQGRAGEHPMRQPRGPPPLEELVALPTSKHEGSKNFATRQRRRAVHSLVRAGIERRGVVRTSSSGSAGSITPISEHDAYAFNSGSGSDNESVRSSGGSSSAGLSRKASDGSIRAATLGAIGGERRKLRDRLSAGSLTSEEGENKAGGRKMAEGVQLPEENRVEGQRRTPLLVLTTAAEKRKTSMY